MLCQVTTRAKELHLFSDSHSGYTTRNTIIIAVFISHDVIVFILDRGSFNGNFSRVFLKFSGKRSDHRTVRFGSGAGPKLIRVCKKRKDIFVTMWRPSLHIPPMDSVTQVGSPLNSSSYSGGSQEADHSQLHNKVVNKFLDLCFGKGTVFQIFFRVNIQEGRYTT